jgi:hypothetical protein
VLVFQKNVFTFVSQLKHRDEILGRERVRLVLSDVLLVSTKQMEWMMEEWHLRVGGFYFDFTCCFDSVNWPVLLRITRRMQWFMLTLSTRGFADTKKAVREKLEGSDFRVTLTTHNTSVVCFVIEKLAATKMPLAQMKRKLAPANTALKKGDLVEWRGKQFKIKRVPTEAWDKLCSLNKGIGAPMEELVRV